MKQLAEIKDLEHGHPLFQRYCKEKGIQNGDCYSPIEYMLWADRIISMNHKEVTFRNTSMARRIEKTETVESRALTIAAKIMQAAGLCRYEDPGMCRRVHLPEPADCDKCIRKWLLAKAKKELKGL